MAIIGWELFGGFGLAALAPAIVRLLGRRAPAVLAGAVALQFALLLTTVAPVLAGHFPRLDWAWAPELGIRFALQLDPLGLMMALLVEGMGSLIVLYSGAYLEGRPRLGRFFFWFLLFKASMAGLVVADDLFSFFVFWELTSLCSFMLIGFESERPRARAAALQALLVTGLGGQALLAGLILLAQVGGASSFSGLAASVEAIRSHRLYPAILALVLGGAFTKSAQVPFQFWLPNAMEAPTPVSALLHSATLVKAGVFLLLRMVPLLGGTALWLYVVSGVGMVTAMLAAWVGLAHNDIKRLLAYATVAALGILVLLIGLGTPAAIHAAIVFLMGHALYKGALFLVAGAVDHQTGTRDLGRLSGLGRQMPRVAVAGIAAAVSMMGLLPAFGFVGKELVYKSLLESEIAFELAAVVAFAGIGAAAISVGIRPFFGKVQGHAHDAPWVLDVPPLILALCGVALGVFPAFAEPLIEHAAVQVAGPEAARELALWHGLGTPLLLSALSIAAAVAGWALRTRIHRLLKAIRIETFDPQRVYDAGLWGLDAVARWQTAVLQSGRLSRYTAITLLALAGAVWAALRLEPGPPTLSWDPVPRPYELAPLVLAIAGAVTCVATRSLVVAVLALGATGMGESLLYVFFGAPDLAMTQIVVQILSLVLVAFVLARRPGALEDLGPPRPSHAVVAVLAAVPITLLLLRVRHPSGPRLVSETLEAWSQPRAHGRNVVNAILVDFRALDTLGEITVLLAAALGVFGLVRIRARASGAGR